MPVSRAKSSLSTAIQKIRSKNEACHVTKERPKCEDAQSTQYHFARRQMRPEILQFGRCGLHLSFPTPYRDNLVSHYAIMQGVTSNAHRPPQRQPTPPRSTRAGQHAPSPIFRPGVRRLPAIVVACSPRYGPRQAEPVLVSYVGGREVEEPPPSMRSSGGNYRHAPSFNISTQKAAQKWPQHLAQIRP